MTIYGSVPQINRSGITPGPKRLFHTVRDIALILDKTVRAGYGVLMTGTLMAVSESDSKLVPYPEALATVNTTNAKAYLVADGVNASAIVYCTVEDAAKFAVGDDLIIDCDQAVDSQDLGAIISIDITDANGTRAKITATTNLSDAAADFLAVNSACIYIKGGAAAHPFSAAAYILDKDIDTGVGALAKGALGTVVISNAVLYEASLVGYDSSAATDLGTVDDGRLVILK